jgi:hypothetical protein
LPVLFESSAHHQVHLGEELLKLGKVEPLDGYGHRRTKQHYQAQGQRTFTG